MTDLNSTRGTNIRQKVIDPAWLKKFNLNSNVHSKGIAKFAHKRGFSKSDIDTLVSIEKGLNTVYPDMYDFQFTFRITHKLHTNKYRAVLRYGIPDYMNRHGNWYMTHYDWNSQSIFEVVNKIEIDSINVIIRYPELKLINRDRDSHTIHDLFVYMNIYQSSRRRICLGKLMGTRTTFSITEADVKYLHSHLPTKDSLHTTIPKVENFCMGTDAEILFMQAELNEQLDEHKFDEDRFESYLFAVRGFLEYESLEGGPHACMSNVINKNTKLDNYPIDTLKAFYTRFMAHAKSTPLDLDWRYVDDKYEILDNDKLEALVLALVRKLDSVTHIVYKDDTGSYFRKAAIEDNNKIGKRQSWIPFRGEKKYLEITGEKIDTSKISRTEYAHPQIKYYVKQRFEYEVNNQKAIKDGARRETSSDNQEAISRQSEIPVFQSA